MIITDIGLRLMSVRRLIQHPVLFYKRYFQKIENNLISPPAHLLHAATPSAAATALFIFLPRRQPSDCCHSSSPDKLLFCPVLFAIQKMPKKSSSKTSKPGLQNPDVASWDMSKKTSSKPPKPVLQKPTVGKEKPSSTPQMYGQEIDDIFSKKRKKPEQQKTGKLNKKPSKDSKDDESVTRKKKKSKSGGSNVDMFGNEQVARPRRRTADGLTIYTEEELGFGKADAGGTRLCPFDCECCV
ncbi:hypothetical protein L1987_73895 [Smallanthus sonchifolius]|uniref:Uncharacterized protein n=1 Tax=Smallanthus sonchifolius TaxID=185202 RepID=A0ACB9A140_9ASTR|nr:hypothetical protein L1987_73895 [Smallanthus sonchifolius]